MNSKDYKAIAEIISKQEKMNIRYNDIDRDEWILWDPEDKD